MSGKYSFGRIIIFSLAMIIAITVLAELLTRVAGYTNFRIPNHRIISEPDSSLIPDNKMGFVLTPGKFTITINDSLTYQATHDHGKGGTHRIHDLNPAPSPEMLETVILGCSFTYGMGVNDWETFPYLLNSRLKSVEISNYAVPGYGTIQAILQMEEMLLSGFYPNHVVYCYNGFHKDRNAMSREFELELWVGEQINKKKDPKFRMPSDWAFPFGVLKNDGLKIDHRKYSDIEPIEPLRRYSAIANAIKGRSGEEITGDGPTVPEKVTMRAIERLYHLCADNGIRFHIAFMTDTDGDVVFKYCHDAGMNTVDISIDLDREGFRNMPWDHHPSRMAHQEFYSLLGDYLEPYLDLNGE